MTHPMPHPALNFAANLYSVAFDNLQPPLNVEASRSFVADLMPQLFAEAKQGRMSARLLANVPLDAVTGLRDALVDAGLQVLQVHELGDSYRTDTHVPAELTVTWENAGIEAEAEMGLSSACESCGALPGEECRGWGDDEDGEDGEDGEDSDLQFIVTEGHGAFSSVVTVPGEQITQISMGSIPPEMGMGDAIASLASQLDDDLPAVTDEELSRITEYVEVITGERVTGITESLLHRALLEVTFDTGRRAILHRMPGHEVSL